MSATTTLRLHGTAATAHSTAAAHTPYYGSDNTAIAINDSVAGVEFQDGQVRTVINGKAK